MSSRVALLASCIIAAAIPLAVMADLPPSDMPLGPGCHYTTADEAKQLTDRGIPVAFETCPKDTAILGIGQDFDQWYAKIKSMSPCSRDTCTLSCRTRNTGAQVCGPTASRWNSIGCHPNNNTAIFPAVSYGFAAHIELLRRYCGERGRCTIGSVVQQWTGISGDVPAYADFVSRAAGIPVNEVFDPNDVDLMGRLALAMSCYEAGSLPYDPNELKQGLAMAGGGARVPAPSNVGQLLNESMTGSYSANAVQAYPSSWSYPPTSLMGGAYLPPQQPMSSFGMSPFGGITPPSTSPYSIGSPTSVGSPYGMSFNPSSIGQTSTGYSYTPTDYSAAFNQQMAAYGQQTSPTSANTSPISYTSALEQLQTYAGSSGNYSTIGPTQSVNTGYVAPSTSLSAATIITQPIAIRRGDSVLVSWTSVGMKNDDKCRLFIDTSQLIAQANEGTQLVPTTGAASSSLMFTLQCKSLKGDTVTQTTTLSLQ